MRAELVPIGARLRRLGRIRGEGPAEIAAGIAADPGIGDATGLRSLVEDLMADRRSTAPPTVVAALAGFFGVPGDYVAHGRDADDVETGLITASLQELGAVALAGCRTPQRDTDADGTLLVVLEAVRGVVGRSSA